MAPGGGISQRTFGFSIASIAFILTSFGILMIYSASTVWGAEKFGNPTHFLTRQLVGAGLGLGAFWVCAGISPRAWRRHSRKLLLVTLLLLVLVFVIGSRYNGARRWIRFGGTGFQPSELAKLAVILHVAAFLARNPGAVRKYKEGFLTAMAPVGVICLLTMLEPDYGTALFLGGLGVMVLIVGGLKIYHFAMTAAVLIPAVTLMMVLLFEHVGQRLSFLFGAEPGYQVKQAYIALGSGGLWGRGIGAGTGKLFFLPEVVGDFIFPAIGEEIGFVGVTVVILLFLAFAYAGFRIARGALGIDRFSFLAAVGITMWISLQAITNLAVVSGTVPTKGIALPFISYGSSSLTVSLGAVGILTSIAVSNHRRRRIDLLRSGP